MKYLFVINPISGKGRGKNSIPIIEKFLKSNCIDYKFLITQYPKNATEYLRNNCQEFNIIVSVGGDGTLNEVVNGIPDNYFDKVTLGVLQIGTGNDFSKNIISSKNIVENLASICQINKFSFRNIDLGTIEYTNVNSDEISTHKFINGAGIGFDAYVGALTQRNKVLRGISAYLVSVIKALFNYKMINVEIKFNNVEITGNKLMITFGNGISHGGGFYLTPNAKIDDGILDISVFEEIKRKRLLSALPKALVNKLEDVPEADFFCTDGNVFAKLNTPYYFHCDGEIISDNLKTAKISLQKGKIKIIENF